MYVKIKCVSLLLVLFVNFSNAFRDYYWRDYTGMIPFDAFPAGDDVNTNNIYIGAVFIKSVKDAPGIFPTTIFPGKEVLYAAIYGSKKSEQFAQILCTQHPQHLRWIEANSTHLHLTTVKNHLVRGGQESDKWTNIGRVRYQGNVLIGKILSGNIGDANMYFVHNGEEILIKSYQVLAYDDEDDGVNRPKIRIRV